MLDVGKTKEFVNIKLSFQEHTKKYAKVGDIILWPSQVFPFHPRV